MSLFVRDEQDEACRVFGHEWRVQTDLRTGAEYFECFECEERRPKEKQEKPE